MRQKRKLNQLRDRAWAIESKRARAIRSTLCVGLEWEQVVTLVSKSIKSEHEPIVNTICEQIGDYTARTPPSNNGYQSVHGFVEWIEGLEDGRWSLPEELPEAWLATWRDGYEREFSWAKQPWSPRPHRRCEGCRLALPHVFEDSKSRVSSFNACPACGGTRISGVCFYDMRKFSLDGGKTDFY